METKHATIRGFLEEHGEITINIHGASMLPMLRQNRDLVTLRRYDGGGLHKYDVAMYDIGGAQRKVLHRVVEVGDGCYTFLGDNCDVKEYPIPEQAIVAVMTCFYRGKRMISADSPLFRLYGRVWYFLFPVRRAWKRTRRRLSRIPWLKKLVCTLRKRA